MDLSPFVPQVAQPGLPVRLPGFAKGAVTRAGKTYNILQFLQGIVEICPTFTVVLPSVP